MISRIFLGLIGLLALLLLFDSARLLMTRATLFHVEQGYSFGAQNADLDVIEFLDYADARSRSIEGTLRRAIEEDESVRLIPRPVFSPEDKQGRDAALLVYAAGRQGKFIAAHRALLENFRAIDPDFITEFAKKNDMDAAQLAKDFSDPALLKILEKNRADLSTLKSQITPTFLFGRRLMLPVADNPPDSQEFLALFKQGRRV
jgi:protein-disulfide isomerase